MIVGLRGQIRNSFDTPDLYNLLKTMASMYDIQIYIHTWNKISNNLSWRSTGDVPPTVSVDMIHTYFKDLVPHIQHIQIEDDTEIKLIGDTTGFVGSGPMPKKGWKNMWYGKYKLMESIRQRVNEDAIVVNMRFDILTVPLNAVTSEFVLSFIAENAVKTAPITFTKGTTPYHGCDNLYIGHLGFMYSLLKHFYMNVDSILTSHTFAYHQEYYLLYEYNRRGKN